MKNVIGFLLVLCGIIFGVYVGVWLCFIGGIVDIIEQVCAESIDSMGLAIGIVKMMGASGAGGVSSLVFIGPGIVMLKNNL